jgi:hypothetical protein
MTFDQARQQPRRAGDELVAEAAYLAAGWRFLTIDGLTVDCEADLETYNEVLCAFDEAAAGREHRYAATSSRLTLGICGAGAEQRIAALRARLAALNPSDAWSPSARRWEIRDGGR